MKKRMARLPNQSKRLRTHSSCVTQLGDIIDANLSGYERSYDQRVTVDHGEWCLRYGFNIWREVCSIFHMDLPEQVYKARFVVYLRKNILWHDILYWPDPLEVYIKNRTTCTEWRGKMILHFRGTLTTEDIWVWHGTTWWTSSWWIETLPRVKWVPTFKVECRRLDMLMTW